MENQTSGQFKWVCLVLAGLATAGVLWMLNDMRVAVRANIATVDEHLPRILENTDKSTETLAVLSEDIAQLRDLAGVSDNARDKSLVAYADSLLDKIEKTEAQIGLKKKVFGSGLKDLAPAQEWVVAARKEALYLSFRAKSKEEMLDKLTHNFIGSAWYIQFEGQEPEKLIDWLQGDEGE